MSRVSKWMQPAEVVTTIGLVITLIFLIVEVRENTAVVRSESYAASVDRLNDWRLELAADSEMTELFVAFREEGVGKMNPIELQRFTFLYGSLWSIYESTYYATFYETLGQAEWARYENMICRQYELSVKRLVWQDTAGRLSRDFVEWVQLACKDGEDS